MSSLPIERTDQATAGLSTNDARLLLDRYGPNTFEIRQRRTSLQEIAKLFANPLVLILLIAAVLSAALGEVANAVIIFVIISLNVALNFRQISRSRQAMEALRAQVDIAATCLRDGKPTAVPHAEIVPGDVVLLNAGNVVPADGRLAQANELFVNESALTGESIPVEKHPGDDPAALLAGTSVMSGTGTMVVSVTGHGTAFGKLAAELAAKQPETEFERGTRRFALLITRMVLILVLFVLVVNVVLGRSVLESFLFAIALAIGLTPELLPMITSVTLAHGAMRMAKRQVLVKHLPAMQNLGSMDVLCSDKTGTLTEGAIVLERSVDATGAETPEVLRLGAINSAFESGLASPLDEAVLAAARPDVGVKKIDELPFDFERRRVSVVADQPDGKRRLIAKGAPESILPVCSAYSSGTASLPLTPEALEQAQQTFEQLSRDGYRVLAVASREIDERSNYTLRDEADLTFGGFLAFLDPAKTDAGDAIRALEADGVRVVILTGDNDLVARKVCNDIGMETGKVVVGAEIDAASDEALKELVQETSLFARLTPGHKRRIVLALRQAGHVVGFLGDGINDAPSLRAADVGISVDSGTDVAKDAAEIILMERELSVLHDGVREGRESFGNVMKYVLMGISSNFGNMLSMAVATVMLPFLPMLPIQVLLNNLLYDASQTALPLDRVDAAFVRKPRHWDVHLIQRFMFAFGPVSSMFDLATFLVLRRYFDASETLFHTGWFIESLATQTLVIYVIRSSGSLLQSKPSRALVAGTAVCLGLGLLLPFSPLAHTLGFVHLPGDVLAFIALITVVYLGVAQLVKQRFYERFGFT